ncbi:ABC transporter [Streptomyces coacervatus]|uniref:ABC transporter n=1 Tax=Streptomyces coacervatus TaxID=647381 RepID=A0ABP7JEV8_9ACTN|nr:ABC transporter permease [Streptomyces coacervatus]MDF2271264.1 ABC transporter permease [Streptomyces coacervatus]
MSAVMEATAPPVVRGEQRRTWAAVFALARFEARELLQHIPVAVTLLFYVGYTGWKLMSPPDGMDAYPALQDADRATQTAPLLFAIALFVCVNRAALRDRRRGTDRHFDVLVMEPWRRTAAHALSVVPFGVLTALVVGAQFTWQALRPGAVGHGSVFELAVAPLYVLLFGALGLLVARLIPSAFAAPLAVIGLFTALLFVSTGTGGAWTRWLSPVVGESSSSTLPSELIGRPAGWHALYLGGLVLVAALAAVLFAPRDAVFRLPRRGGWSRSSPRPFGALVGLGGALVLAVTGAVGQSGGVSSELAAARERASVAPEKEQSCVRHGGSQYCAFGEWTGRTGTWAGVVDRIQALAGGAAADRSLLVRQRIDARYGLDGDSAIAPSTTPGQVTVGTRWGGNRVPEFAVGVASVLVGGDEKKGGELCDGRVVTVMWLALGGDPDPVADLKNVRLDDSLSGSAVVLAPTSSLSMSAGQTDVVRELLVSKPRAEVTAAVKSHWAQLTAPGVTTAEVARVLGTEVPKGADECGK